MLASPYLAGSNSAAAVQLAHQEYKNHKFTATLDMLGENSLCREDCDLAMNGYKYLIDEVHAKPLPVSHLQEQISIS